MTENNKNVKHNWRDIRFGWTPYTIPITNKLIKVDDKLGEFTRKLLIPDLTVGNYNN